MIVNVFKRHNSCFEKAGDGVFHLKTNFGNKRLVNRHNSEEGEEACTIELCYVKIIDCRNRSFPVNDLSFIQKSSELRDYYVPNCGTLEDGIRYFV